MLGEISPRERGIYQSGGLFLINNYIVGKNIASTGTITFSSIPQVYTHLKIIMTARSSDTNVYSTTGLRFNNDSGSNYIFQYIIANAASVTSSSAATTYGQIYNNAGASAVANSFGAGECIIPFYSSSISGNKSWTSSGGFANSAEGYWAAFAGNWLNTSAINTLTIINANSGSYLTGSIFSLYGIY